MNYRAKALEILQSAGQPMTYKQLVSDIPGSCGETISRAMRALYAKGKVTRQPQDPNKPTGTKLWTAVTTTTPTTQPTNSTSSGKTTIMCLPQNKPTTVTATLQVLQEMISEKKPFSAHDVTKKVRDSLKDGKVNIDHTENGTVFAYGKKLAKVDHEDVKGIVHEYFNTGKMDGWTREMAGGHWEYKEDVAVSNPQPPVILVVPVTDGSDYDGTPTL